MTKLTRLLHRRVYGLVIVFGLALMFSPQKGLTAGGAFAVDDSEIDKPGACKVEAWYSAASNSDRIGVLSPACVVNLGVPIEVGAQVQRVRGGDEWSTTGGIKGKINLIPLTTGGVGVGLSGSTNWETVDRKNVGSFINMPVTFQPAEQLKFNVNIGWLYDAMTHISYASWGTGFEFQLLPTVTLIGELFGVAGKKDPDSHITDPRAQLGIRFTPVENIDLDLIYGCNITGENADWVTAGVNVRF
jgi:hypothetical protein